MVLSDTESLPNIDRNRGTPSASRTFLVVAGGICVIAGYWIALPRLLPPWNRLLNQIAVAQQIAAQQGILYGKLSLSADHRELTSADMALGVAVLLGFYVAKIVISRRLHHRAMQIVAYAMLVSLILPYIYLRWEDWGNPNIYFVGNWFGMAVGVLAVPTVTFLTDLFGDTVHSRRWMFWRSALEILIVIPVWTVFWALFSFFFLGFGWI